MAKKKSDRSGKPKLVVTENKQAPELSTSSLQEEIFQTDTFSGQYSGQSEYMKLTLRVDIDGPAPMYIISGDLFSYEGKTESYYGSFIARTVKPVKKGKTIGIHADAEASWQTDTVKINLLIPLQAGTPTRIAEFSIEPDGSMENAFTIRCSYDGDWFRQVQLQQAHTPGTTPFNTYAIGALPSGRTGTGKNLGIRSAYREAGVDIVDAGMTSLSYAAPDIPEELIWTNAELHQAMVIHFSLLQDNPQWAAWILHTHVHVMGPALYGIMFDDIKETAQRHGCAVFYSALNGAEASQQRMQLFTCVHELGHCFNLMHSFQKSEARPAIRNRQRSLSWMNYPAFYPGSLNAFWKSFAFQFDKAELKHIRHGFYEEVIMGGHPFSKGAALTDGMHLFKDVVVNKSPLRLELASKPAYYLGEPVYVETRLTNNSGPDTSVIEQLHADDGFITIGILKPNQQFVIYEPFAHRCVYPSFTTLNAQQPPLSESSYIGYHQHGFIFDQAGNYEISAFYQQADGSRIVSEKINIRVRYPVTREEDNLAGLLMQKEVGLLFLFLGSDASYLQKGNDTLQLVIEKYNEHPLSLYAMHAIGTNLLRSFKTISKKDNRLEMRAPDYAAGIRLLQIVVARSYTEQGDGLDNITLYRTIEQLFHAQNEAGYKIEADNVIGEALNNWAKEKIKQERFRYPFDINKIPIPFAPQSYIQEQKLEDMYKIGWGHADQDQTSHESFLENLLRIQRLLGSRGIVKDEDFTPE